MGSKVLVAMSGGVDSSTAALLLRERGYDCVGCTMKLYDNEAAGLPRRRTCCSLDDVEDARAVAFRLGIPYYVFNFKDSFRVLVMEKFASSWEVRIQAFQSTVFAAMCNRVGTEDAMEFAGQSLLAAPDGDLLYKAGGREELLILDIPLEAAARERRKRPWIADIG